MPDLNTRKGRRHQKKLEKQSRLHAQRMRAFIEKGGYKEPTIFVTPEVLKRNDNDKPNITEVRKEF